MNVWRPYPLLRLALPFTAGIIAEEYLGSLPAYKLWLTVFVSVMMLLMQYLPKAISSYRFRIIYGVVCNVFLLVAGYEIACNHRPVNDPDYLGKCSDGLFIAAITEPPAAKGTGTKAIVKVLFRSENGCWKRTYGSVVCFLKVKQDAPSLHFGDHVILRAVFSEIRDNSNPHSFNYSAYLRNKGITHQVFAESHCWKQISLPPAGIIRKVAFQVRDRLLNILRDNHVEGREFAVAAALLLGYVDDIDAELRKDYAATGAMHILSVSGMHVGIIYIFLEFLLGFLNKNRSGRLFKAFLLLCFIWFYAMITGLSPCVLRSAAMLSLPIIGKSLNRSPGMYNIIAASLVFILAMDPFLVRDVGFQLSYLAVTGILVLYKPIYDIYVTSAWLPDKLWSILAVSIAAQIATLPITLYTFHQFPNYFMVTNIFVVPLSSLIIYIGILAFVTGGIPILSALVAKLLIFLIWSLNSIIHFIEQLPYSTISGVYLSSPEMFLLYLIIATLFLFLTLRRIAWLYLFLIAAIILNLQFIDFRLHRLRTARLTIFNANREALYLFTNQDKAVLLYQGGIINGKGFRHPEHEMAAAEMNAQGVRFHREFRMEPAGRPPELAKSFVPMIYFGNFIQFGGYRIARLTCSIPKSLNSEIHVDLLILSNNPKIHISDVVKTYHPDQIIIDATNSRYKTRQWLGEAAKIGVKCQSVAENGAYQKEL